jgi:hypothetical protein
MPVKVTSVLYFNPVASAVPKWRTFKFLRWMQNLHQLTWDHGMLYAIQSLKYGQRLIRSFL